ncbi:hypothetical protein ABVT39_009422 [Epinephelus coioides]
MQKTHRRQMDIYFGANIQCRLHFTALTGMLALTAGVWVMENAGSLHTLLCHIWMDLNGQQLPCAVPKMEDKLIIAVCGHPERYDVKSPNYKLRTKKDLAWRKVSEEVGLPVRSTETTQADEADIVPNELITSKTKTSGLYKFKQKSGCEVTDRIHGPVCQEFNNFWQHLD